MTVRNIGVLSLGKISGLIYAAFGLMVGVLLTPISLLGALGGFQEGSAGVLFGLLFGVGAIFFLPLLYGVMGWITGILCALFYNLTARFFGGLELEME